MFMRYEWGAGIGHTYSWKLPLKDAMAPSEAPILEMTVDDMDTDLESDDETQMPSKEQEHGQEVEAEAEDALSDREREFSSDDESDGGEWTNLSSSDDEA